MKTKSAPTEKTPSMSAIIHALYAFIAQRGGIEPANYGDYASYRAEARSVTKDRHDAETLLRQVELCGESVTAEDIVKAAKSAFSGRLEIVTRYPNSASGACPECKAKPGKLHSAECASGGHDVSNPSVAVRYCTGQYFPTEYRKAACAVCASVLWERKRRNMPPPVEGKTGEHGGPVYPAPYGGKGAVNAGQYLRDSFKREFGHRLAARWFN